MDGPRGSQDTSTDMEPENELLEKTNSFWEPSCSASMLVFGGSTDLFWNIREATLAKFLTMAAEKTLIETRKVPRATISTSSLQAVNSLCVHLFGTGVEHSTQKLGRNPKGKAASLS